MVVAAVEVMPVAVVKVFSPIVFHPAFMAAVFAMHVLMVFVNTDIAFFMHPPIMVVVIMTFVKIVDMIDMPFTYMPAIIAMNMVVLPMMRMMEHLAFGGMQLGCKNPDEKGCQ